MQIIPHSLAAIASRSEADKHTAPDFLNETQFYRVPIGDQEDLELGEMTRELMHVPARIAQFDLKGKKKNSSVSASGAISPRFR